MIYILGLIDYDSYRLLDIQVSIKVIFLNGLKRLFPLISFIENIYLTNSDVSDKYYAICEQYGRLTQWGVRLGVGGYAAVLTTLAIFSAIESVWTGEVMECMFIYFPFAFNGSLPLLVAEILYNHASLVLAMLCLIPTDAFFILIFVNFLMMSAIVQAQLNELDTALEDPRTEPAIVRAKLGDYLVMHIKYNM